MDEWVDILDDDGTPIGETQLKSEAHRLGLFHPTVHIWCYDKNGFVLLQQRGKDKTTFPLKWDVSVAGHVAAGEPIELGALREVEEEIGVKISNEQLEKIAIFKTEHQHSEAVFDREFNHTFLCKLSQQTQLKKQESEVETLEWFPLEKFKDWVKTNHKDMVPNLDMRYEKVIAEIESRL
ncbi:NUDIX hydrolase [Flagellimonas sp.]|uniref:NUDIX hydrolase n=1 Tax=Flagellimonas sp. TaxID=2058762 RepID=UPI003F4A583B